ncbi:hypothetical protein GO495_28600, partial [Chitinophaga oryziterrae]
MRKFVTLLILCIFCVLGMVQAQTTHINIPDTVCMSTTNSTSDQAKFTSVNASLSGGTTSSVQLPVWTITTPGGTDADYNILYSANPSPVKATKLVNSRSLTLEFLVPGTYTFTASITYVSGGVTKTSSVTQKIVAVDCTINTCNGGYAVMAGFNEDFGTMAPGVARRPYPVAGVIQYTYQPTGDLVDEYYAISATTKQKSNWLDKPDHTGNTNGAMLVVNSAYNPSKMYEKKVTGLCSGSVYNFSAWFLNVNIENSFESLCLSAYQYAGVTFQVVDANNPTVELAKFRTYAVSMMLPSSNYKWQRYGGQFTIPAGVTDVLVRIINNKPGGCGNDIAIDDISFTYCSPIITAGLVGSNTNLKEVLCEGTPDTLTSSILPVGYFKVPVYQWEMSDDNGVSWFNVPYGTARDSLLKIPAGALKGTKTVAADYLFRVRVYEKGIADSLGCANPSSPIKITILPMPILSLTKSQVCAGAVVELEASGGFDRFEWRDLPGYVGATRQITLVPPDTTIMVYGFVYYGEGGGKTCKDSNTAYIKVDDKPIVEVAPSTTAICLGDVVDYKINKALAGMEIRWYHGSHGTAIDTTLMPEWNGATDIEVQPGSLADSIYSVMVRSGTCEVESAPLRVIITQTPPKIKFPPIINCSSANPTGVFNLPDSTQAGVIGSWSIVSYTGIDLQPGETIDDYVKIYNPAKMNTKVSMPYGSTVVIGWTAQPVANGNCKITSTDTLSLVNNPTYSDAGPDQTQCGSSNVFTMAASAPDLTLTGPAAESGKWTLVSGVATIADATSPTTTVTVAGIQDVVLTWAITNAAGCAGNVATVTLHKTAPPSAVLKAPLTICSSAGTFNVDTLSTTGAPTKYVLKAGTPALPGFVTMTDTLVWPITVTYPTGTLPAPNTYNFILTVATANPGCTTDIPFSLNISSPPTAPTGVTVGTPSICDTGSTILTVVGGDLGKKADGVTPDAKWKWYKGACGGTPIDSGASIAVHGIAATTTYYVRAEGTCGNTTCASGTVTVYTKPAAAAAGPDQSHCNDSLFTMAANKATAGAGVWTIVSGTATITTSSSEVSTIFVKAGNTATLRWTITNGVCTSNDDIVLTNYKNIQANAGADQNHCATPAFTMAANTPATGSGLWTVISGAATITTPASATSTVTVATGATATLRWTITNGSCTTTDDVVLTNYATPTTSAAGAAQTHCNDSLFTMAANTPTVGTGLWTIVSGTATITTPASPTSTVFVLAGNSATLQWTISNGTCTPSSTTLVLTNNKNIQATAGADQNHCATPAFTMAANTPATGSGLWTVVSGAATITTPASATSAVTVATGATATLRWTITNGNCTTTDDVVLTNYATPTTSVAGSNQSHCSDSLFTMAANTPTVGTGLWTIVSGTATITTPTSPTTTVFVLAGKTATLQWTISNGTCAASSTTVVLTNSAAPTPITPAPDQTHCSDSLFTMAATPASLGAGVWTILSGTATITTPASPTSTVFVLAGNTATLRWTITNGACVLTDDVVLTNNKKIQATAGADQNHCATPAFTMAANTPATGSGLWTLVSGAATITTPASATSAVTVATGATATLRWTITNGNCTTTDDVVLTNYATPTTSAAGAAQTHCNDSLFTMAANTPTVGTGLWTIVSGTATITTPASPTSTVFVLAGNTATLQWTISNGTCTPSSTTLVLTNNKNIQATAGADQTHCATPAFTMAANTPATGSGLWTVVSGAATITTPASATSAVTVATGATATLRWTITNGTCITTDDVVLTNYATPTTSVAGPAQSHCSDSLFTMAANAPTVGTGLWTIVSGTATITTPTSPTSTVFVLAGKTATLQWTISNGTCAASSTTVVLTNYMKPANAAAGPDLSHCNDSLFTMAANKATLGTGTWTIVSGTATITTPSSEVSTIFVKAGNTATLRWTITNGVCTTSDDIILSNAQKIQAVAGPDQGHCVDPNFTLAANTPTLGTGVWTLVKGTGTIATPTSPTSAVTVATGDSAYLVWTITNGLCTSTDTVVLRNAQKAVDADAGTAQEHCGDPIFILAGNTPDLPSAIGTWTVLSPASVKIAATEIHKPNAVINVPAGVTATLTWTIANLTCTTSSNVTLTNFGPILGNTITADQTLCATETPATLTGGAISGGKGTYTYQWIISTDSTNYASIAGATNNTYSPGVIAVTTWFKRVVTSGGCVADTSKSVKLQLITKPPVVVTVPAAITTDCIQGKDYTTLFGTPTFSHAPYSTEVLTVTSADVTTVVDACTTTIKRTWTATDRCGLTTSAQQTITVVDRTAPVFTTAAPANVTVDCDKVPAAVNLTAKDDCAGMLTVVPSEVRQDIPGACTSNYLLIRKWVIADACGNVSDTLRQTVTVKDLTPPVFTTAAPANITVDCDKLPAKTDLTATDNCTPGIITVTPIDSIATIAGACKQNYRIVRKWVATDNCGNTTILRQTITVQDTSRPVFSIPQPANVTVDCDKVPALPTVTATDNCTAVVTVTVGQKKEFLSTTCSNNYKLTRTWTAKDDCGNTTTMSQVIVVQDTTRPTFTVIPPADTTISCDAIPAPATNLKAIDNCSATSNVKIAYSQTRQNIAGACASNYQLIRTWTAKDECGNSTVI